MNSKEDTKNEQQDNQSLTEDEITQEPQRIENNGDKNNLKTKTKFDTEKVDLDPNAKDSPYKAKDKVENETATPRKRADAEEVEADKLLKDSKTAKQGEYKNKYPLILVHGFFGGVGENRPVFYPNYWVRINSISKSNLKSQGMKYMKLQLVLSVVTMIEKRSFIIISKAVV